MGLGVLDSSTQMEFARAVQVIQDVIFFKSKPSKLKKKTDKKGKKKKQKKREKNGCRKRIDQKTPSNRPNI